MTQNWDLNLSYLDQLPRLTSGPRFTSGLLKDVMEEMIKIMHFPHAWALNYEQLMGIWK